MRCRCVFQVVMSAIALMMSACTAGNLATIKTGKGSPAPISAVDAALPLGAQVTASAAPTATGSAVPQASASAEADIIRVGTLTTGRSKRLKLRYRSGSGNDVWFSIDGELNSNPIDTNPGRGPYFNLSDGATSSIVGSSSIEISVRCKIDPGGYLLGVPDAKRCTIAIEPRPRSQARIIKVSRSVAFGDLKEATSSWLASAEFPNFTVEEIAIGESMVLEFFDDDQRKPQPGRWAKLVFTEIDSNFVVLSYAYRSEAGYLPLE